MSNRAKSSGRRLFFSRQRKPVAGGGTFNPTSAGAWDVFVTKLGKSGELVWAERFGGPGDDQFWEVTVDDAGRVYSTGWFAQTADFDPGPGTANLTSLAALDGALVQLIQPVLADIVDVLPDPRTGAVDGIIVRFTQDVTGVDIGDFSLTRDGAAVDITSLAVTPITAARYSIDLSAVTAVSGAYVFALGQSGSGITGIDGKPLVADVSDSWTVDFDGVGDAVEDAAPNNGNVITLHLIDGERGDDDLTANGTIVDPGAPASFGEIVEIDVKPGSNNDTANLASNGVLPVVIYTTADFDVLRCRSPLQGHLHHLLTTAGDRGQFLIQPNWFAILRCPDLVLTGSQLQLLDSRAGDRDLFAVAFDGHLDAGVVDFQHQRAVRRADAQHRANELGHVSHPGGLRQPQTAD